MKKDSLRVSLSITISAKTLALLFQRFQEAKEANPFLRRNEWIESLLLRALNLPEEAHEGLKVESDKSWTV